MTAFHLMTAVTCMLVLTLNGFAGEPLDPAKPDEGNAEWRMRHSERVAEVKSHANDLDVLFLGDSITSGWRDIGKALWEKEFVPLHAVNIGIAGSQTSHILWQFENGAIDGIRPRVAVLMIGVNNVMASPTQSAVEVARGVSTIVAKLRAKLPSTKILLLGTFPKDHESGTPDRRKIQELNSIIAKLDDGKGLRYLDISGRLLDKDNKLTADVSADGVHLTEKGYQTWADAIMPVLREMTAVTSPQRVDPVPGAPTFHYQGNRAPLAPSAYISLPPGAVRPDGWLRRQLELQANGYNGRLPELSWFLAKDNNNAWVTPDGSGGLVGSRQTPSGGEEVPYWLRGYCLLGYVLGDEKIIKEAHWWIERTLQSVRPDGFFGPERLRKDIRGVSPYLLNHAYMMHALMAYYEYTGDRRVIDLMTGYFRWQMSVPQEQFFSEGWQHDRVIDNLVAVHWLYNLTGETWLLQLAENTCRAGRPFDGQTHNVNIAENFCTPTAWWIQSAKPEDREGAERNYQRIWSEYGQVPGGMFCADEQLRPGYFDPRQGSEACGMVEVMRSCENLLCILGETRWADRCEDVAFNSYPASVTADYRAMRYITCPNMAVSNRGEKSPDFYNLGTELVMDCWGNERGAYGPDGYRCCLHNTGQSWARYAQHLWLATPDNGLAAMLYAPCRVKAKVGGGMEVTLTEKTRYPFEERIELAVALAGPANFPLKFRVPAWCKEAVFHVNGQTVAERPAPGSVVVMDRKWSDGDQVVIDFPMRLSLRRWAKNGDCVSIDRGPLTYSLKIGEKYVRCGGTDEWPQYEILPTTPWNFGLVLQNDNLDSLVEVVQRPWPADDQPFAPAAAPILLKMRGAQIPGWSKNSRDIVDPVPRSPVATDKPVEPIELIPMGAARLRISAFPVIATNITSDAAADARASPDAPGKWEMGPFVKLDKPVFSPTPDSKFHCPISDKDVLWEEQNVYNPAVVVKDGKVYLLYRADDKCWWKFNKEDQATSRIGLAWSENGRHFTRHPTPVVFPDKDAFTKYEWPGGCQDVHVVEGEDGTYYMNYTAWGEGGMDSMCVATSKDLIHWQKHGPAFAKHAPGAIRGSRSGVVVARQAGGKLLAVKINGQYLMYYTHPSALAVSDNLIDWQPLGKQVWGGQHESGAIALWRDDGILLMFNGQNLWNLPLQVGTWALGQALIDRHDLVTVRQTMAQPLLQPEFDWEKKGYCSVPATVANGMVSFKGEWLLYYGAADRHIGLAICRPATIK
ncbi:MAG: glycoside hydrolase family 127 protein [Verrucomicrobia bacterium]|nr:glycoside hydrolase family 127 protein [Verrucomicrobiota bacterium]